MRGLVLKERTAKAMKANLEPPNNFPPLTVDGSRLALSTAESAAALGASIRLIQRMNASGRLPRPMRVGRAVRWSVAELHAWMAAGSPGRDRWERIKNGR